MRWIRLFGILTIVALVICGCNNVDDAKESEITLEAVSCKEMLRNWFDEGYQPALERIVTLDESEEADNYKITLCEMLSDNMGTYILIKIETKDGSKLKTGDVSKAPDNFRGALTDIDIEYSMHQFYKEKFAGSTSGDWFCEKVKEENDSAAYYVIEGFFGISLDMIRAKASAISIVIDQIKLYEPYMGFMEEKESVLTRKSVMFEISKDVENDYCSFVTESGETGYLYNNAFLTAFAYDIDNPPNIRWEMEYDGVRLIGNYDNAYVISNGEAIYLKWIGKYLDKDKVAKITINGKEYFRNE